VRSDHGGILLSSVKLGKRVSEGQRLGTVTDPISNEAVVILAPYNGHIIGMAFNQFVIPGFAPLHVARQAEPGLYRKMSTTR
jgi:predicted deacylase